MSGFMSVGYFLFTLLFSTVTFFLWLRFALRYFRVSSLHPISQTINTLTNPIVKPVEGLFKSSHTRSNPYDWACLTMLVAAELIKLIMLNLMLAGAFPFLPLLLLNTLKELIVQPCNLLFYAILIRVVMSWVNPYWKNPLADLIYLFTEPTLRLARKQIPVFSGIDFSPFIVMIVLKIITLFIGAS